MANQTPIEVMQQIFKEQHRQMIDEQKKMMDGYTQYFDGMINQMDDQTKAINPPELTEQEKIQKEIENIRLLLDDAVNNYGKQLASITSELLERQKKSTENVD